VSATDPIPVMPVPPPRSSGRGSTVLVAGGILLLTFVAGIVLGAVGDRVLLWFHPPHYPSAKFLAARLDRRLHFSPEQRKEVERILTQRQDRIRQIWDSVRPQVRQEIDQTNAEIERILTPEQKAEFEKIRMRLMPRRDGRGMRYRHD